MSNVRKLVGSLAFGLGLAELAWQLSPVRKHLKRFLGITVLCITFAAALCSSASAELNGPGWEGKEGAQWILASSYGQPVRVFVVAEHPRGCLWILETSLLRYNVAEFEWKYRGFPVSNHPWTGERIFDETPARCRP